MRTDLHIHTTASDGTWTPERLIKGIVEYGIELFAVTDHDSVANICLTEELAAEIDACFIRGVEISTTFLGHIVHILGYGINPTSPSLLSVLEHNQSIWDAVNKNEIQQLIAVGYPLDFSDFLRYQYDRSRGGWKSLNFLIDNGLCHDLSDYNQHIRPHLKSDLPAFTPLDTVIKVIRKADGIPVLAHPGASLPLEALENSFELLLPYNLAGMECFAQYHDEEVTARCVNWCKAHQLLITGGSDYHGGFVQRKLGYPRLDHAKDLVLGPVFNDEIYR
jgi:predicted metal-dependent phosphoesterase TrpH